MLCSSTGASSGELCGSTGASSGVSHALGNAAVGMPQVTDALEARAEVLVVVVVVVGSSSK